MHFENWLQLRGEAPDDRRILSADGPSGRHLGLVHNLGGYPGEMVSFVSILGTELG
jgi:acetyl-CoA C-acetyltransferase